MKYNYQDITNLQKSAGVDFEIADKAFKKSKGDLGKADYLARKMKIKAASRAETTQGVSNVFNKFFRYRFVAFKNDTTYINIRMWIVIIFMYFFIYMFELIMIIFIVTLFIGVEYKILCGSKKSEEPLINVEPVAKDTSKGEDFNLNLSEEVIEDDDEGFVKVEIDK